MECAEQEAPPDFGPGLVKVRKRRLLLWILIAVYMPAMWTAQQFTRTFWEAMPVFWVWFVLLIVVMTYSALARCPRCGNYFHMNGMSLLYLRKCLHCQLHVAADKGARRAAKPVAPCSPASPSTKDTLSSSVRGE